MKDPISGKNRVLYRRKASLGGTLTLHRLPPSPGSSGTLRALGKGWDPLFSFSPSPPRGFCHRSAFPRAGRAPGSGCWRGLGGCFLAEMLHSEAGAAGGLVQAGVAHALPYGQAGPTHRIGLDRAEAEKSNLPD